MLAPTLAGHGDTVAALAATTWNDWLASAERGLDTLRARTGGPVAIAAFSMGSLLALHLARLRPDDVAALVLICPALRLAGWKVAGVRALRALRFVANASVRKPNGSDISIPEMRHGNPALPAFPLAALAQLLALMDVARADLPLVRAPALVVDARHDHVVHTAAAR